MIKGKKIVMCGCHESGWDLVKILLDHGITFSYFVTISPQKAEEQNVSGYCSFEDLAEKYNIPIYVANKYSLKSEEDLSFFEEHKFDLLIQGGWQRLFPDNILKTLSIGAIGVHGSADFLPIGRGRSPINWSIIENKKRFVFHYFLMKPGVDDGDIFHQQMTDINEWDDCRTLYLKNSLVTSQVLLEYIPKLLEGNYKIYKQVGTPSYYPKRIAEDGLIDWNKDLYSIYNFIRAITHPYPGAFSYINKEKIYIWKAQPFDTRIDRLESAIGEIIYILGNKNFILKCKGGLLLVTEYTTTVEIKIGQIIQSEYEKV
jgi:methionyl-tRNA formyltransferase